MNQNSAEGDLLPTRQAVSIEPHAAETALRESEERFRAVWEATSEAMALSDPDGVVLAVNPAYGTLYGRPSHELIGQDFAVIFPAAARAAAREQYRAVFTGPEVPRAYEAIVQRPDGSERVVEARADFLLRDGVRVAMISAIRDVTERKQLERAQQDFVAMASHDLATPVTVLRAWAQLMQRRQAYSEESIAAILEQTTRMERLIADLRELVQVEGGGLSIRRESLDLIAVAGAAVERARTMTADQTIRLEASASPVIVVGDRDRLGQILDNLLGNAIKYSPAGEVLVRVETDNQEASLQVIDRGPGIATEVLPHLFERFYRGEQASGAAGLGLGLYISRMLVEAHCGRIGVTSRPGAGSTFTVALPLGDRV